MNVERRFPVAGYAYVAAVAIGGTVALAHSSRSLMLAPPELGWLALAALTWLSGAFAIQIPSTAASISVSEVFVFTLAILFGGPTATATVAIDGLLSSLYRRNLAPRRLIFNMAEPAMSTWVACYLYAKIGGLAPLSTAPAALSALVLPVSVLAASYLLMNTWLTAVVVALESGASARAVWRRHIVWLSVNYLAGASISMLLAVNMRQVSIGGLLLILPLVFLLYLVFRTWTERVREAELHVASIDRLYLSTVEALAIAIESKDQVTHGHVRRVQTLSLAIARHLGISDELELRAIEAGALLHDIGKVAVPDHLLNKPGTLTPDEYELVKLHAPIGGEILKAVDFPYPVVPIVRHHHECWDGSGYPDGIAGERIPIGARIISVVDCFDAITSDRPYRRALTDEAAIEIIRGRRGSVYAPCVVDALVACYRDVRSQLRTFEPNDASLLIARVNQRPGPGDSAEAESRPFPLHPAADAHDAGALDRMWMALQAVQSLEAGHGSIAVSATLSLLRTLTPATTACLGFVSHATQSVEVAHASGHGEQLLRHQRIRVGEGITGWVAAQGVSVVNSDPALDFPDQFAMLTPRLTAALSVPVGRVGVLTLYTDRPSGFDHPHQVIAERCALRLAASLTASVAGDPDEEALQEPPAYTASAPGADAAALLAASVPAGRTCGVLSVVVADQAGGSSDDTMALASLVLSSVRLSDGLVANSPDEVIAVLPGCEPGAAMLIESRLRSSLDEVSDVIGDLRVGFALTPYDGATFADALRVARTRRRPLHRREDRRAAYAAAASGTGRPS